MLSAVRRAVKRPGVNACERYGKGAHQEVRCAARESGGLALVERQGNGLRHGCRVRMAHAAVRRAGAALRHHFAHGFLALAAAGRDAEFELQLVEGVDAFRDGGADRSVGDGLAHADNHDGPQ
ncbi:hypothetical protein PSAC2689_30008 [Paraburkholderia sacchari]